MASLIWKFTQQTFDPTRDLEIEISMSDGSNFDTTENGIKFKEFLDSQIYGNQNNYGLVLNDLHFSLGYGFRDWEASEWGSFFNDLSNANSENLIGITNNFGVIEEEYLNRMPYLNTVWDNFNHEGFLSLQAFFPNEEIEVYHNYCLLKLRPTILGLQSDGLISANEGATINSDNNIPFFGSYGETPWSGYSADEIPAELLRFYTILISLKFSFTKNYNIGTPIGSQGHQVLFDIEAAPSQDITAAVGGNENRYAFAPIQYGELFNFDVSSSFENVPSVAQEQVPAAITLNIRSDKDFIGFVNIYALSSDIENLEGFNNLPFYGEQNIAQYGTFEIEGEQSQGVGRIFLNAGELKTVTIFYTPSFVNTNQTDTFKIGVERLSPSFDSYDEDVQADVRQQFEEYEESTDFDTLPACAIEILDTIPPDVEENLQSLRYNPSFSTVITKPSDIIYNILDVECSYNGNVDQLSLELSRLEHLNWDLAFSLPEKKSAKTLIKEIADSSKSIPVLNNNVLSFITVKNTYRGGSEYYEDGTIENVQTINNLDVISYNFRRTKIEDVITRIEVQHTYDYGRRNYLETTSQIKVKEQILSGYFYTGTYKEYIDGDIEPYNYYGLKQNSETNELLHSNSFKVVQNKYIRDESAAIELANYLLFWNCNQHNKVSLTLPLKYYALEIGDLIEFDDMIYGKKVYNEDYVVKNPDNMPIRCGQYILPLFMVTKTTKNLTNVKIEAIQLHHMQNSPLNYKGVNYDEVFIENISEVVRGDVNQDGFLTVSDIILTVNHILDLDGPDTLVGQSLLNADMNGDGQVRVSDIVLMVNEILGIDE